MQTEQIQTETMEKITNFDDMNLKEKLLRGIYAYGFENPSEIQSKGIPLMLKGGDMIAQSQSGTGKTGTFVIATLNKIDYAYNGCQAIILVPTRELAIQVVDVCARLGSYTPVKAVLCIGGMQVEDNKRELDQHAPIVAIGTPGRIADMIHQKYIDCNYVETLVMDEADEMLSSGFQDQITEIMKSLYKGTQICLFSATLSEEILKITTQFMKNPSSILVKTQELSLEGIRQFYINARDIEGKYTALCDLFGILMINQTMIYVNSKKSADILQHRLERDKFSVSVIHSQMSAQERSDIMKDFRNGHSKVLISTDLLARGIDVQQVSIVINYEIPYIDNIDNYIHRIGRSGRFGRKGTALNLVTDREYSRLADITKYYSTTIQALPADYNDF